MEAVLEKTIGSWKSDKQRPPPLPASPLPEQADKQGQLLLVDFPGATQVLCMLKISISRICLDFLLLNFSHLYKSQLLTFTFKLDLMLGLCKAVDASSFMRLVSLSMWLC